MGGIFYQDYKNDFFQIAASMTDFYAYSAGSWTPITGGSPLTSSLSNVIRFAVYPFANRTSLIATNDKDIPQIYTGTGTFATLGGNPPVARDITVAFQRVILGNVTVGGIRRSSALWISDYQSEQVWDPTNAVNLTDTKDTIVAVRALNNQVFAIYKDNSQWVGIGAGDLFPFVFQLQSLEPGPVGPSAVIQAENAHYYLGQDGDIYKFDGQNCISIGGPVKRLIQSDLDWTNMSRAHGFYDRFNREVWWFWPSYKNSLVTSGVVLRLAYADVPQAFSPLLTFSNVLSASWVWNDLTGTTWDSLTGTWDALGLLHPTWDSFPNKNEPANVVGDGSGQVYRFGDTGGDKGATFDAYFDFPFRSVAGVGEQVRIDAIESFFGQTVLPTTVGIILITNENMATSGVAQATQTVDISQNIKHRALYYDVSTRFPSVRHQLIGVSGLEEYRGGILYAYRRGEA